MFITAHPHVPNVLRLTTSQIMEQGSEMVAPRGCFGSNALLILLLLTLNSSQQRKALRKNQLNWLLLSNDSFHTTRLYMYTILTTQCVGISS
jgi:hypothetical protein